MNNFKLHTDKFSNPNATRAAIELGLTLAAYFLALAVAVLNVHSVFVWVPAGVVAGVAGVRVYMLQHDCMHNALFGTRRLNDLVGQLVSPFALTPYKATRLSHALHHKHVGNLDERDAFEITVMTVEEYENASVLRKAWYQIYRSRFVLLFVGPVVFYMILRRFPRYAIKVGVGDIIVHNLAVLVWAAAIYWIAGWGGVGVYVFVNWVGSSIGALIPYVVHNFEDVVWLRRDEWSHQKGALSGTAILDFGPVFDFLTANIAYHDLHHLDARIPCYQLRRCHRELARQGLLQSTRIGWADAWRCFDLKLYDEGAQRLVPFVHKLQTQSAVAAE